MTVMDMEKTQGERAIKKMVSDYLLTLIHSGVPLYFRMPVPTGYGKPGLDYEGCLCGFFFAIETKAPELLGMLTPRQRTTALNILKGGGKVFAISGPEGLQAFQRWVTICQKVSAERAVSR